MRRTLVNLASATSVAVFVAAAATWAYTLTGRAVTVGAFPNWPFGESGAAGNNVDNFKLKLGKYGFVLTARGGGVEFYWQEMRPNPHATYLASHYAEVRETTFGFGLSRAPAGMGPNGRTRCANQGTLRVPIVLSLLASAALPAWWAARFAGRRVARRRWARGLCPACGYDVRASAGRCQECGQVLGRPYA
jgi:hypothetical protein